MSNYVVLSSAAAGSNDDGAIAAACSVLRAHLPTRVVRLGDHAAHDLDAALDDVADDTTLVAAGGDGTLHHLVQRLRERDELARRRIAILPLGTANDFARAHGIPLDPPVAARAIVTGVDRARDLLVSDDGTVAVNAAHAGLGAEAGRRAAGLKSVLGPLAYPVSALTLGLRPRPSRIEARAGGRTFGGEDVLYVGVANSARLGGGHRVHPHARPDDGSLALLVLRDPGLPRRVRAAVQLLRGRLLEERSADSARARRVEVAGDSVVWDVDGEGTQPRARITWSVEPGAWTLRVPSDPDLSAR